MNPLKAPSELKRPETSILITASPSRKFDVALLATASLALEQCRDTDTMNNPLITYFAIGLQMYF